MPISLVLLFKKLVQLVSLFLLIRPFQLKFCFWSVTALFYLCELILLPFVSVTVDMFYVSFQADHLIVRERLIKYVFGLNFLVFVPTCFVQMFHKF